MQPLSSTPSPIPKVMQNPYPYYERLRRKILCTLTRVSAPGW